MYQDLSIKGFGQEFSITDSTIKRMGASDLEVRFTFNKRRYTFRYVSTVWRDEDGRPITPFLADLFQVFLKAALQYIRA